MFFVLVASLFVSAPAWNRVNADQQEFAMHKAESLAYQILESQRMTSRGPASAPEVKLNQLLSSEGRIGLDPWGRPYQFRILKGTDFSHTKVLVWSLGPDGFAQTSPEKLESIRDDGQPQFEGDDVGALISIQ